MKPESAKLIHKAGGARISQQANPDLGIGGVNRNIKRGCPPAQDALKFGVVHIGKGDVISHHHAQTPVVVLHIERRPQPGGHLINKAKEAVVAAGTGTEGFPLVQAESERLPALFMEKNGPFVSGRVHQIQTEAGNGSKSLIIYLVENRFPIDPQKAETGRKAGAGGRRTGSH